MKKFGKYVTRLLRASNICGLILDPHSTLITESEVSGKVVCAAQRGEVKSRTIDRFDAASQDRDQVNLLIIRHP